MTSLVSKNVKSLRGVAKVPGDKSISHRALMLNALGTGQVSISGLLQGEDVLRTARALISMGVAIDPPTTAGGLWHVTGIGAEGLRAPRTTLDLGNSGTSARLLAGIVSSYPVSATFTGDASLQKRPMGRVIKPLAQMGAKFEATAGDRLPLRITGTAVPRAIEYVLPVASAQVKSAVLLAGLRAQGETVVVEPTATRDHTERMLRAMGAEIASETQKDGGVRITLKGQPMLRSQNVTVPADPSSAAFLTVAALITPDSDVLIPNVLMNEARTGIYDSLIEMGANITFENRKEKSGEDVANLRVKSSQLKGITVPAERVASMIDEFPVFSIAAAFAEGTTRMSDLGELRVKESDRLAAITTGLAACSVVVEAGEDTLTVHGTGHAPKGGATIVTHLDHRIGMSFLVMGLAAQEPVAIDDDEAIATSFPGFAKLLNSLGANISHAPDTVRVA